VAIYQLIAKIMFKLKKFRTNLLRKNSWTKSEPRLKENRFKSKNFLLSKKKHYCKSKKYKSSCKSRLKRNSLNTEKIEIYLSMMLKSKRKSTIIYRLNSKETQK
jgi:hypothetical protein